MLKTIYDKVGTTYENRGYKDILENYSGKWVMRGRDIEKVFC